MPSCPILQNYLAVAQGSTHPIKWDPCLGCLGCQPCNINTSSGHNPIIHKKFHIDERFLLVFNKSNINSSYRKSNVVLVTI